MTMSIEQPEVIQSMNAALQAAKPAPRHVPTGPAIDHKPLFGAEIHIKIGLPNGAMTLLATPITVAIIMALGYVILKSLGMPVYGREMVAGGIVNTVGGLLASLPVFFLMKRGVMAIAQAALLGIAIRCGACLLALMLAMGPGWALAKMPLAYWVFAFYFPMLAVETGVIAWLSNKSKY